MSTEVATKHDKCVAGCVREPKGVEIMMEAVFSFMLKGAKRLVQLNPSEFATLKKLAVEFAQASEGQRGEILDTILEIILPDDLVGGVASRSPADSTLRERVDRSRKFIGSEIRASRESLHLTQRQLAEKAGIPQSHVSRLEGGKHTPTRITIERIAKALGIAPDRLDPGYCDTPPRSK